MKISIIGIGLIGSSLAIDLKQAGFAKQIIGVDKNVEHLDYAIDKGIIDVKLSFDKALAMADLVVIATPVNISVHLLHSVLDKINNRQTVVDMGSTKRDIIEAIQNHPNRSRFVAAHPMAGTENSGPQAALQGLFCQKKAIICNREASDIDAVKVVEDMFRAIHMSVKYMDALQHDIDAAYVSHLSHAISYALSATVQNEEQDNEGIMDMASGGFDSTVRLAASSPKMWVPIFQQNRENVSKVLDNYIDNLNEFKSYVEANNAKALHDFINKANNIEKLMNKLPWKN